MANRVALFLLILTVLMCLAPGIEHDAFRPGSIEAVIDSPGSTDKYSKSYSPGGPASFINLSGNSDEKVVALTFDDGPFPMYTPLILEILKRHGVKATFFVNGNYAEKLPQLIVDINKGGHEIGNHTYSHKNLTKVNSNLMNSQLERTDTAIYRVTGKRTVLLRPPGGRIDRETAEALKKRGYTIVMYSVNPGDFWQRDPDKLKNYVTSRLHNGGIILLHNGFIHTVRMLPGMIDEVHRRGYRFVTVSELAELKGIYIPPRSAAPKDQRNFSPDKEE